MTLSSKALYPLLEQILKWFLKNRENHFFRVDRQPYKTWISEVALQQTRMAAALPQLQKFLECFPNIKSLAKSSEDEVVRCWQGLGYYNRARNLRKGALYLVENHNGEFPKQIEQLLKIPSIGQYTAAAIASIHFGENSPVIDGNIKRIFSRFHAENYLKDEVSLKELLIEQYNHSQKKKSKTEDVFSPGDLNEGLMEFGQKICTPKKPLCSECFLADHCLAFRNGNPESFPPVKKMEKENVLWKIFIVEKEDETSSYANAKERKILVQKLDSSLEFPFLQNHYALPGSVNFQLSNRQKTSLPSSFIIPQKIIARFSHTITRYRIEVEVYQTIFAEDIPSFEEYNLSWQNAGELENIFASSLMRKAWKKYSEKA